MASSDEEGEIIPDCVTNYHVINSHNEPISFSILPLIWSSDEEEVTETGDVHVPVAFLAGATDGGLQPVYKEVIGWKLELSYGLPEVYMLSKRKMWIKLLKPRKCYEYVVKSVLIVARCLHFAKRNVDAARDEIWSYLVKCLSSDELVESLEKVLSAHLPLIRIAMANDENLAKSKYLKAFLMGIENPERSVALHEEIETTNKQNFIVSDNDEDDDGEMDDEPEGIFDSVCAFCDNGGEVLTCEGECMRSFHPTVEAGVDTCCESLGFKNAAQYEAIATFLCDNCKHQKHQCFHCGKLGSSDKSPSAEVFPCISATCGHFYHPECVANLLHPSDETLASQLQGQISAGKSFTCPIHKCHHCKEGENRDDPELQFAVCRRCPEAYHRRCLPKKIVFEGSADGTIKQRAWDDLLPKRILMYCMKHVIIPDMGTPKRDHIRFPSIVWKRNQEGRTKETMTERRSKAFGNFRVPDTERMPKVVEKRFDTALGKRKSSTMCKKTSFFDGNKSTPRKLVQPSNSIRINSPNKAMQREQRFSSKPVKKREASTPPKVDDEMKAKIMKLVEDTTSSFDFEEFIKEKKRRCTHKIYSPQHANGLDKTITLGRVEASVKTVKAALKKLDDGGSVEDAKAVCEPHVLNQIIRWKKKLSVFLAPFLIGERYTSFGRHFTKVDKLKEIVNRLHLYVKEGDTIVDFCCGSNDFSCLMKEKLDSMGKKCNFKNYDLITPKNTFNFEKRDWFSVAIEELPHGSRLIMGLNPPFGVKASLANLFIDHALKFKPKLIILIVPEETRRLDRRKKSPYDLVWEEHDMFYGKSFYLPGSADVKDQLLDDWNVKPPLLSLWSRPDWTADHIKVAMEHGHVEPKQTATHHELAENNSHLEQRAVSNYLMEENRDCFGDFSNIMTEYPDITTMLDDVPDEEPDDLADMDLASPVISPNSRFNPPCIQPGPHPDFGPPQYANVCDPYGPGVGFGYTHTGHYANYGDPGSTSNNGRPNYGQQDLTNETDIWPPGTTPPRS